MTIASETARNDYTGNGAVDTYTYGFKIFDESQLLVTQRNTATPPVETTLVLNTDYTVTGVNNPAGGTIVLDAGNLATDFLLAIKRDVDYTQETDIRNQGPYLPELHEDEFDLLMMAIQQLKNATDRSMQLPETGTTAATTLPIPAALKLVQWDAAGTALQNVDAGDISSAVTTFGPEFTLSSGNLTINIPVLQAVGGGAVDAITATAVPAPASLTNNLTVMIEAAGANATTTPTLNLNGLGAKTIVKGSNTALVAGDIVGANFRMLLSYDASLDKWVLLNPAVTDAGASKDGVQKGTHLFSSGGGIADVYTATLSPTATAYTLGMEVRFKVVQENLTTTPTLDIDGVGAKTIVRADGSALRAGDLPTAHLASVIYDTTGTVFELQNPALGKEASLTLTADAPSPPAANTLYKDLIPKAWLSYDGATPAILDSVNVSGVVDEGGVGDFTVSVDRDFSTVNFCVVGMCEETGGAVPHYPIGDTTDGRAVGTIRINTVVGSSGASGDVPIVDLIFFGRQA